VEAIVERVSKLLVARYVFADTAHKMAERLRAETPKYRSLKTAEEVAKAMEKDLRTVAKDVHVGIEFDPPLFANLSAPAPSTPEAAERDLSEERRRNYGFAKSERLAGNIGYLEITRMSSAVGGEAGNVAAGAMASLASADAVILDLRRNPGGSGRMNQFVASYFFAPDDERWLVTNENRSEGKLRQEWTQVYVPGARMPAAPLYILVGPNTGSAAEGFAYSLQALKRATVIGTPTAGGAHSGSYVPIRDGIVLFLPTGRVTSPVTKSNWEGAGVQPDERINSGKALPKAHLMAMERLRPTWKTPEQRAEADWETLALRAQIEPVKVPEAILQRYVGRYRVGEGVAEVKLIDGELRYLRSRDTTYRLIPLTEDLFTIENSDFAGPGNHRARFVVDASGKTTKMLGLIHYSPGKVATFEDLKL
jgi:hypothetical protein